MKDTGEVTVAAPDEASRNKAIEFINQIAEVAEKQEHHPVITNSYNYLKIELKTHDVNGISNKDFKLAKTIDNLS